MFSFLTLPLSLLRQKKITVLSNRMTDGIFNKNNLFSPQFMLFFLATMLSYVYFLFDLKWYTKLNLQRSDLP